MSRVIGQFSDDYGNEYVLLDDPDDDLRNAPPVRRTEPARRPAPAPRAPRAVPVQTVPASGQGAPMARVPQAQPVQILQARDAVSRDAMIAKTAKVLDFVELFTDGVAELIPLPDRPPRPTGELPVDLYNQNEHRQALHAHRVLTSRVRTSGRVLSRVFQLLLQ